MLVSLVLLLLSGGLIVYTYFGYGQLLQLVSARPESGFPPCEPPELDTSAPSIAILICAHNEEQRIAKKLDNCLSLDYPAAKIRIVIVSDGSTDRTEEQVRNYPDPRVALIVAPRRQGKAACINLGMEQIDDEIVLMVDVRQTLSHNAVRDLARHFRNPIVGAVSGKLQLEIPAGTSSGRSFGESISRYWKHEVQLRQNEATIHSVIGVTGAIYALRRKLYRPIPPGTILDDVLIPMNAVLDGYRVLFEKDAIAFDNVSSHPEQEKIRKIRTLAGNFQLLALRPELLSAHNNPVLWMFLSHKVLRLLVPLALLIALGASAALYQSHWLFSLIFWGQVSAYAIAFIPEKAFMRISIGPLRIIRTFVQMHWYILLGLREYLANRDVHIWDVSSRND